MQQPLCGRLTKAGVDRVNKNGVMALFMAAQYGKAEVVGALLRHGLLWRRAVR